MKNILSKLLPWVFAISFETTLLHVTCNLDKTAAEHTVAIEL